MRMLTTSEVATLCRVSPRAVREWRYTNKGPVGFRLSKQYVYSEADVVRWIEQQRTNALIRAGVVEGGVVA